MSSMLRKRGGHDCGGRIHGRDPGRLHRQAKRISQEEEAWYPVKNTRPSMAIMFPSAIQKP